MYWAETLKPTPSSCAGPCRDSCSIRPDTLVLDWREPLVCSRRCRAGSTAQKLALNPQPLKSSRVEWSVQAVGQGGPVMAPRTHLTAVSILAAFAIGSMPAVLAQT